MPKITKRIVDAAQPDASKKTMIWDSELKGFGLRITPAGAKSYVVMYRTPEGRQREITIGKHGSPWTAEQAREKARELLYQAAHGTDLLEAKTAVKAVLTIAELGDLYLKDGPSERPSKKESSWNNDRSLFQRHIIPLIGSKPITKIKLADIARMQADIADGKTSNDVKTGHRGRAIVTGGKGIAAHAVVCLKAAYNFAIRRGLVEHNPAVGVYLYPGKKMERFLTVEEASLLGEAAEMLVANMQVREEWIVAVRLLMLTGCRKNEILGLQWRWIDTQRGIINFPTSKTGAKPTVLPEAAMRILDDIPRKPGSPYVFPAMRGDEGHMISLQAPWELVRQKATEIGRQRAIDEGRSPEEAPDLTDLRLHDLRHSYASFAVEGGASLYLVGKVLGHKQAATTQRYAHLRDDPLKALANETAAKIADAVMPKRRSD